MRITARDGADDMDEGGRYMPKKIDYDITWQFHHDLMAAYRKIAPTCYTQEQAWRLVAESPAPRFYITGNWAGKMISLMLRFGMGYIENLPPVRRRLYAEIFARFNGMAGSRRYVNMDFKNAGEIIVLQPAPEFYCSPATVQQVFYRTRRGSYTRGCPDSHRKPSSKCHRKRHVPLRELAEKARLRASEVVIPDEMPSVEHVAELVSDGTHCLCGSDGMPLLSDGLSIPTDGRCAVSVASLGRRVAEGGLCGDAGMYGADGDALLTD